MGIKNLNYLFANATDYSTSKMKFNTIIIDGSNLIITYLCATVAGITYRNPSDCIIDRTTQIIKETVAIIKNSIVMTRRKFLNKDGNLIIMFDTSSNPDYKIRVGRDASASFDVPSNGYKIVKAKEQESLNRAKRRCDCDKSEREVEMMRLNGATEEEIIIKLQKTFLNSPNHHFKLVKYITDVVVNELSSEIPSIKFYRSLSETDFVIRNLALVHTLNETDKVLIMSADTDYLVLTSDIENVYVKKTQHQDQKIIYPYEAWRQVLNRDLSYEEVCMLGIIFGCDYNNHSGYILIDKNKMDKTIEAITALFKTHKEAKSYFNGTRMRTIKSAIKEINNSSAESFLTDLVKVNHKHLIEIYNNWEWNADFIPYECDCTDLRSSVLLYLSKHAFEMPGFVLKEGDELKYDDALASAKADALLEANGEAIEDKPKKYNVLLKNITYLYNNEDKLIDNVETYVDELLKEYEDEEILL